MTGQDARQLVGAERREVARGGKVTDFAVASGEGPVGDLAHQGLHESELPALGRAGVGFLDEEFAAHEGAHAGAELGLGDAADGGDRGEGEGLAEDCRIADEAPIGRREAVEPARD